jgi:hypothetical protein
MSERARMPVNPASSGGALATLVVVAAVASSLVLHAMLYGPGLREKADQVQAEQIDREDRALCSKLGLADGGKQFAVCADVLLEARRLEANRLAGELPGIL